jgi:hypothetical protein
MVRAAFREASAGLAKNKLKTAIYDPPKKGMPYLVVTLSPEGVVAIAVESKEEARVLMSKKTLKVLRRRKTWTELIARLAAITLRRPITLVHTTPECTLPPDSIQGLAPRQRLLWT